VRGWNSVFFDATQYPADQDWSCVRLTAAAAKDGKGEFAKTKFVPLPALPSAEKDPSTCHAPLLGQLWERARQEQQLAGFKSA